MDNREILTGFKSGALDRQSALALLTSAPAVLPRADTAPPPPAPAASQVSPVAAARPATPPPPSAVPVCVPVAGAGDAGGAGERYAVVGIGGRYPQAADLAAFWHNTAGGCETGSAVPAGRPGQGSGWGHFLAGAGEFDAAFFGLTDAQGALMDPQERLFLETAWQTLESAGCTGARLESLLSADGRPRSLGVWAAVSSHDYPLLTAAAGAGAGGPGGLCGGHWTLPGRLSGLLDLCGPSQCVDTAGSSFLVAVHLALGALRAGECAAALVGAVELRLHPSRHGDGGGEGVGAVLLKPLAAARADGDTIHALVCSSAVGHTRRRAQDSDSAALARRALAGAGGIPAAGVTLHETRESVRAAVGDAGAATGAAAFTRALLQLREGQRAPAPGRSGTVPWARAREEDGREAPRRASVTVRGEGGTEAHLLLEEHLPGPTPAPTPTPAPAPAPVGEGDGGGAGAELVLLSAPTPEHLVATARRLAHWLSTAGSGSELAAVARELRVGRAPMDCRLAVTARDTAHLAAVLDDVSWDPQSHGPRAPHTQDTAPHTQDTAPAQDTALEAAGETVRAGETALEAAGETVPAGETSLEAAGEAVPGEAVGVVVRGVDLRGGGADPMLLAPVPETREYLGALWRGRRLEQLARLWLAGVEVSGPLPDPAPVVVLPPSALRRRVLWTGAPAGPEPAV